MVILKEYFLYSHTYIHKILFSYKMVHNITDETEQRVNTNNSEHTIVSLSGESEEGKIKTIKSKN